MSALRFLHPVLALLLAPLLPALIGRTRAIFAGRRGAPLLQTYRDIGRLLQKGAVTSRTTTGVFQAGPVVSLAAILMGLVLVPLGALPAAVAFPGDFILLAYLLGVARFAMVAAALDTGSSFEGMGAAREVQFAALAEPALFLALAAAARVTGGSSLSTMVQGITGGAWAARGAVLVLVAMALLVVYLAENARVPVDDPATHLELTMIHEVMVLDHSGPGLAFIQYGSALKLWVLGAVVVGLLVPAVGHPLLAAAGVLAGLFLLAIVVGVVESTKARLRMRSVPHLLVGAAALSALAVLMAVWVRG